jgi:histidinol dehydrogenase
VIPIHAASDSTALAALYRSGWDPPSEVVETVRGILADVRARGDEAIVDYTRRFDDRSYQRSQLRIPIPDLEQTEAMIPSDVVAGLSVARDRVARFHERQLHPDISYREGDGTRYELRYRALDSVAAYVPGGSAPLPSSVIMTCIPAKVAGVGRTIVLTPPQRDGTIDPAVLYACRLCDVDELYAVGGAQAIAAAAYGTQTIAAVDKIVGPGNVWVTEAKRQVFGICAIDGLAGPSEVLVVADEGANCEYVVGELLAQAEHDPLARVALVSQSRAILEACAARLAALDLSVVPRGEIIGAVLARCCFLIEAASLDEIDDVIASFAPEHLALQVRDPQSYLTRVRHVGAVFAGDATPVACGDYLAGTNHVLPTSGAARFSSGLSLADYRRTYTVVQNSPQRMEDDAETIAILADFEGLRQHAQTARLRAGAVENL